MSSLSQLPPKTLSFLTLLCAIALNITGETLLKHGMNDLGELQLRPEFLMRLASSPAVVAGFALVFGAAIVWLRVISREPLSWAFPMLALSYIPLLLSSRFFLGEVVSPMRWLGALVIIAGVILVFRS